MTMQMMFPQRTQGAQNLCAEFSSALSASSAVNPARTRKGISLIEVLISMFVLLFGLMGVAAIFPVGNHYVVEGEKFDLGAALAQNAFEELKGRGLLRTEHWQYADVENPANSVGPLTETQVDPDNGEYDTQVIQPRLLGGNPNTNQGFFNIATGTNAGPGHAFVIDPLGAAAGGGTPNVDIFPRQTNDSGLVATGNAWNSNSSTFTTQTGSQFQLSGERWPVRRITVLQAGGLMSTPVGETIFRLRDDLAVEQPEKSDVPSQQRWDTFDTAGTPDDQTDDQLLRRQYKGDYSWLATVVPTTDLVMQSLQPASHDYGQIACDVSVVVFRKRDFTPSGETERRITAELLPGGELIVYSDDPDDDVARGEVDAALDDIRAGTWFALMGVNQSTGDFVMKWYRILSMGTKDDTEPINVPSLGTGLNATGRRLMLIGPDWPAAPNGAGGTLAYIPDLRATFFPGAISVVTKPLRMESSSLWDLE